MGEIKVWAQMFFSDGSVSEGIRIPAEVLDDGMGEIRQVAVKLLQSVSRNEGFMIIWGAGNIFYRHYVLDTLTSSSWTTQSLESDSLALEP